MSAITPPRSLGSPLAWLGGGALLGALLGPDSPIATVVALGLSSALALVGLRIGLRPRAWVGPTVGVLALLATPTLVPRLRPSGRADVEGLVIERSERGAAIEVSRADDERGDPLALERVWIDAAEPEVGDRVRVSALLRPVVPFRNESPHPSFSFQSRTARAREVTSIERETSHEPMAILARTRAHVRTRLHASLAADVRGLVSALVLGDAAMSEDDAADARAAGLSHVVAVSGMHVTLVVGAVVFALSHALRRSRWIARRIDPRVLAWWVGLVLAPLYAAFAGGSPSAWRAAVTASITWGLAARGRTADPLAVTALVIVLGCLVTPDVVASPAFVLSVIATAAVLEPRRDDDAERSLSRLLLRSSVRAALATAPFTLWCFGTLPPLSIVANVVVVPIVAAVLLPLGTAHAMIASVSLDAAALTAAPTELVVRAFLALSRFFAERGEGLTLPPLDGAQLVVVGLASFALLRVRSMPRALAIVALAIVFLAIGEAHLRARESGGAGLRVTFLDVGQGDAALVDLPDGQLWLVDTGGASFGSRRDPGLEAIVPVLEARRRSRVDVAVITHPHPDHYGGFAGVASRVVIGALWDSGQARDEQPDGAWRRGHRGLLVPLEDPETICGPAHTHGGARIEVLWPCPRFDPGWDANDNSLVLRITYGRRSFLLMGDAERHTETALLERDGIGRIGHVDVVKTGHHGSRTSSTEAFVQRTRPWLAVMSAGVDNRYGHPHDEVLTRWSASAEHVARTDLDGSVMVWTDGERLEARTWSGRTLEALIGRESVGAVTDAALNAGLTRW